MAYLRGQEDRKPRGCPTLKNTTPRTERRKGTSKIDLLKIASKQSPTDLPNYNKVSLKTEGPPIGGRLQVKRRNLTEILSIQRTVGAD
ncbi:hypothetical protein Lal_00001672 [Lupinus albus]|nr:hypothetical protein Lal_00001672 [Lupinus albus]